MGELTILNYGEVRNIVWQPDAPDEVQAAEQAFDEMVEKGFSALRMDIEQKGGNKIDRFDASAEKILMFPFLVGG